VKVSNEVPMKMLDQSREFNDYEYALVHLFETNKQYYNFYKESSNQGRHVILDNSVFELEEAFDADEFAKWIIKLRPTEYIIPDVLNDSRATIDNIDNWLSKYDYLPGKKIGVIQASSLIEFIQTYKVIVDRVDKIAISFDSIFYENLFTESMFGTKFHTWMYGRIYAINQLIKYHEWAWDKPHHLLGCSLPQEFTAYKNVHNIQTIDTSNPVVHGILDINYKNSGLDSKESIKLIELINSDISERQQVTIMNNINKFRALCAG